MFRPLLSLASPRGTRAKLSILIFHRVLAAQDPLFPEEMYAERFVHLCGWLKDWFRVLPLDEAVALLAAGSLPSAALSITFDDGYRDNLEIAAPILRRFGLTATVFIATGYLDGGRMWNDSVIEAIRSTSKDEIDLSNVGTHDLGRHDLRTAAARRKAIDSLLPRLKYLPQGERASVSEAILRSTGTVAPGDLMMTSAQVAQLAAVGMQIGAHTVSHPILSTLDGAGVESEVVGSKRYLEQVLQRPVNLFAYPNGKPGTDYSPAAVDAVKQAGFTAAVSTSWGVCSVGSDPFQLPRFTPWERSRIGVGGRLLANLVRPQPHATV